MQADASGPLATVFAAPGRYIQGRGAISRLGEVLQGLKVGRPLIVEDPIVEEIMGEALAGLSGATRVGFNGECSPGEIDRVAAEAREAKADAIVGIGGGKALDTAKAVAHPAGLPLVNVPTIASTDAPTSAVSVVYSERARSSSIASSAATPTPSSWTPRSSWAPRCASW